LERQEQENTEQATESETQH
jgi:hypothetical protein